MKSYFTTVKLPNTKDSMGRAELSNAITELIGSLRITLESLDEDNFSSGFKGRHPSVHVLSSLSELKGRAVTRGDILLLCSQDEGNTAEVTGIYVYKGESVK